MGVAHKRQDGEREGGWESEVWILMMDCRHTFAVGTGERHLGSILERT